MIKRAGTSSLTIIRSHVLVSAPCFTRHFVVPGGSMHEYEVLELPDIIIIKVIVRVLLEQHGPVS